jgi:hypothetical protein
MDNKNIKRLYNARITKIQEDDHNSNIDLKKIKIMKKKMKNLNQIVQNEQTSLLKNNHKGIDYTYRLSKANSDVR